MERMARIIFIMFVVLLSAALPSMAQRPLGGSDADYQMEEMRKQADKEKREAMEEAKRQAAEKRRAKMLAEVEKLGERIYNLERAFNCREGISRKDDHLPYRTSHQPIPSGPSQGMYSPPQEFNSLLDEYYQMRDWDKNGIPTAEKLKELGLDEVAKDLHKK